MSHENLCVQFDGADVDELYDDLLTLEVELDDELTGMFRLTVALLLRADGTWSYLDDDRFAVWRPVVITAGLEGDAAHLLTGYVTHVRPDFGAAPEQCVLEIWGMDAGVLMDRIDHLRGWPDKRDSDVATELFQAYGLTPEVTGTAVVHDQQVSTIIQRETDLQLLKRLALRNGFECYVDGDTGYFGPPRAADRPQPVLAVQFGEETTVSRFSLEVDALTPADVAMYQIDHMSGDLLDATASTTSDPVLGATGPAGLRAPGMAAAQVVVAQTVATGAPEMSALCQGLHNLGEWFVTGEGEVVANQYGTVLKPRAPVTIKGIGETHSGVYYVTHVTHRFDADGYRQSFKVRRNALMPTGDERFTADDDGLPGALAGAL
jgi:phage protein D